MQDFEGTLSVKSETPVLKLKVTLEKAETVYHFFQTKKQDWVGGYHLTSSGHWYIFMCVV